MAQQHNAIDYLELGAKNAGDYARTRAFFEQAFGWTYRDHGPAYCDTKSSGVASGINGDPEHRTPAPLPVIYVENLEDAQAKVTEAGGIITRPVFSFPGGRRFHFADPAGNELAAWSDK